jgi:5-methylcytosine-specific restriction protein A
VSRRRFTKKDRARIFAANNGACHLCGNAISVGEAWEIEHVIAWELTRDDSDENLRPAHAKCHKMKTHKQDRPAINEAKRREAKHTGAIRPKGRIPAPPKAERTQKAPVPRQGGIRFWPIAGHSESGD